MKRLTVAEKNKWDVIIIGAGLAGLKAAEELKKTNKSVLILEARDRVGGRVMRGEICGQIVDFGGQWLGASHSVMRSEAAKLGIKTYKQYTEGDSLISANKHVTHYRSGLPKLPLFSLMSFGIAACLWQRDIKTLPAGAPWSAKDAEKWDRLSVEAWIKDNVWTETARDLARFVMKSILCSDPSQISYLYFLECLRQGGGLKTMIGVEGGSQQDKFINGAWLVCKSMADKLGKAIIFNAPALSVEQEDKLVHVITPKGRYSAARLIIAVPPPLAARIHFSRPLPAKRVSLLQRMPMGSVIKMHIAYKTPFWRQAGLSGAVIGLDRSLGLVFDQTPPNENVGILVGLIEANHAIALGALSQEKRKQKILTDLKYYFGNRAAKPLSYVDYDWSTDKWALGGYGAYMPPGVMTSVGSVLRKSCGRIHWAGTETATKYIGYFEGAVRSGIRAAGEILAAK